MKLTTIQAAEIECGSDVSNWIAKNKAAEANEPYGPKFGYPFPNEKCYSTFNGGQMRSIPLEDNGYNLTYSAADRIISSGSGLLH